MTTLINHYVRKTTKAKNTVHWDVIFDDGAKR